VFLGHGRQDARNDNHGEAVQEGQGRHKQCGLPSWLVFIQLFDLCIAVGIVAEKDEEQDETAQVVSQLRSRRLCAANKVPT
jgi:hypothetical protein